MRWLLSLIGIVLASVMPLAGEAASVHARFDLDDRRGVPFPTDRFTREDPSQNTGLRVNVPKPDCTGREIYCFDLDVINTLDGFNVQPRLSVPFDGAIEVRSVTSRSVFLVRLQSALPDRQPGGRVIGINQIVWDVATTTLHVESDEILEQQTRYALVITKNVLDQDGKAVKAAPAFLEFIDDSNTATTGDPGLDAYRTLLRDTLRQLDAAGVVPRGQVVTASVFTTQSVTTVLEKIRDQIKRANPAAADFALDPAGTRAVYRLAELRDIRSVQQTRIAPPSFSDAPTRFSELSSLAPGAVGTIAFGKYLSPDYLAAGRYIPIAGTRLDTPRVQAVSEVFFNVILPAGAPPPHGWPVAIFGHGGRADKQLAFPVAARMAAHGIATIAINAVGHGLGPLSTLTLIRETDEQITLPAGGRGLDTNGDGLILPNEGFSALTPRGIILSRDTFIQTAADLMQLVRVIEVGMDVDGDGVPDLDASRIYYFGHSLGANYGAVLLPGEPSIRAGVLVEPGGPALEAARLGVNRVNVVPILRNRSLLNVSNVQFDENLPLRDLPPVINTVRGAVEIQEFFDNFEWVGQGGDVVPYSAYLHRAPLIGVGQKAMIIQFSRGDRTLPNPTTTAMLRSGDLADRTTYYRFDLFLAAYPDVASYLTAHRNILGDPNPHGAIFPPPPDEVLPPALRPVPPHVRQVATDVAVAAQEQIATFFASDGERIIDPDGPGALFETPIVPPLPEDAVFFP